MSITGATFLFVFLPISLALFYISPKLIREYILLIVSLLFYAIGSLKFFGLFCIMVFVIVLLGRLISLVKNPFIQNLLMLTGILINISVLAFYKYIDNNSLVPLGISFFTFKSISYLADVRSGKAMLTRIPIHDALYLSFFAQIQSGPLSRYNDMNCIQLENNSLKTDRFIGGVYRFMIGFNKKMLLANMLSTIVNEAFSAPIDELSQSMAWLGSVCFSLQLFFDFSGYSDMAIGITNMFGYECPENFNYPYMTKTISEFWRRWHITLGAWFRDYVYIPLGGSRTSKLRVYFNLLVVWLLTGIWHGKSLNFIAWGLLYFLAIAFERIFNISDKVKNKIFGTIYHVLILIFINFEWVLFRADNLTHGLKFIKRMLIPGVSTMNIRAAFLLKDYAVIIIAALILCFPIFRMLDDKKKDKQSMLFNVCSALTSLVILACFIWGFSLVIAGNNNPFAYANF